MYDKFAVIGNADLVFPFRALGIHVYSPESVDEVKQIMETLERENVALCFIQEGFFKALRDEGFEKKSYPVVVGFSDYRQLTDYLGSVMKKMAIRATGSDSLVKRRGENESR